MIRALFILFIFVSSLYALSDSEILKRAYKHVNSNFQSNQFRAYNDYKNLYLRALMSENNTLKIKSLNPCAIKSLIIFSRIGLSPIFSIGFGISFVKGRSLVPNPPTISTTLLEKTGNQRSFS